MVNIPYRDGYKKLNVLFFISIYKMSTEHNHSIFDQEALANWVELCNEYGRLRDSSADQELLNRLNVQIVINMTNLLPNMTDTERTALALVLLAPALNSTEANHSEEPIDSTDPIHNVETSSIIENNDDINVEDPDED